MPLFRIQDDDRPGFVVAETFARAIDFWQKSIAQENDGEMGPPPRGVELVCEDDDMFIDLPYWTQSEALQAACRMMGI